jgi:hypothetical protein
MTPSDYETRGTTRRDETQRNVATRCKKFPFFQTNEKVHIPFLFQNKLSAPGIAYDAMSRLVAFEWAQGCMGGRKRP